MRIGELCHAFAIPNKSACGTRLTDAHQRGICTLHYTSECGELPVVCAHVAKAESLSVFLREIINTALEIRENEEACSQFYIEYTWMGLLF